MRFPYQEYFEKQKKTDTLLYSTLEAHCANHTPRSSSCKLALPIHRDTCLFLVNGSWNLCYAL